MYRPPGEPGGYAGCGAYSSVPPGAGKRKNTGIETHLAEIGYGTENGPPTHAYGMYSQDRKRSEESYFDDDEDAANPSSGKPSSGKPPAASDDMMYQPAPGSPSYESGNKEDSGEESDDPLDAFMAGIEVGIVSPMGDEEKQVKTDIKDSEEKRKKKKSKGIRDDIEGEDELESYCRYMEENPMAGVILDEDDQFEYDEDGNVIIPDKKKIIDPLPPIDHTDMEYQKFNKNFYAEHADISNLNAAQVNELRTKLNIKVSGYEIAKPVTSFAHFGLDQKLMEAIRKANYTNPTPIQAQAIPVGLSGRDVIGVAKTGSGKTAAFILPLIMHIMDQKEIEKGDGPIGLICAPTRELSQQIYHEARKFGKVFNLNVVCAYGGGSMYEQCKACEEGAEIIVCTPGRLIDLVKKKATNLARVTYLVLDEADRMFDMGFEPQVRSIANHIRPNRQTLLFSATFKRRIEKLCRDILVDPIRILQGECGEANEDILQIVKLLQGPSKWSWLCSRLVEFTSTGSVLIFVTKKANSDELANNLQLRDFKVGLLHGDMSQIERNEVISKFKKKEMPILVATDVAARGLDIPSIKTVVNYDVARDIDTHTHRIGRTGRAGEKGTAYTLVTLKDKEFAGHLVRNLEGACQYVPDDLLDLAMQVPWFKSSRQRQKAKKNKGLGSFGIKERPGLGSSTSTVMQDSMTLQQFSRSHYSGPQTDRVATLKNAFAAQYKSNFVGAQEAEPELAKSSPIVQAPIAPNAEMEPSNYTPRNDGISRRRKRSRWE